jgi:hypothetical protein
MPGPMSRPDGHRETPEERIKRGQRIMRGEAIHTGKTRKG